MPPERVAIGEIGNRRRGRGRGRGRFGGARRERRRERRPSRPARSRGAAPPRAANAEDARRRRRSSSVAFERDRDVDVDSPDALRRTSLATRACCDGAVLALSAAHTSSTAGIAPRATRPRAVRRGGVRSIRASNPRGETRGLVYTRTRTTRRGRAFPPAHAGIPSSSSPRRCRPRRIRFIPPAEGRARRAFCGVGFTTRARPVPTATRVATLRESPRPPFVPLVHHDGDRVSPRRGPRGVCPRGLRARATTQRCAARALARIGSFGSPLGALRPPSPRRDRFGSSPSPPPSVAARATPHPLAPPSSLPPPPPPRSRRLRPRDRGGAHASRADVRVVRQGARGGDGRRAHGVDAVPGGPGPAHAPGRAGGDEGRQVPRHARGLRRAGHHQLADPAGVARLHHGRRGGRGGARRGRRGRRRDARQDHRPREQDAQAPQGRRGADAHLHRPGRPHR